MNDLYNNASLSLIEKFDNQLRDILSAEIRAVKYTKNNIMDQFNFINKTDDPLKFAS